MDNINSISLWIGAIVGILTIALVIIQIKKEVLEKNNLKKQIELEKSKKDEDKPQKLKVTQTTISGNNKADILENEDTDISQKSDMGNNDLNIINSNMDSIYQGNVFGDNYIINYNVIDSMSQQVLIAQLSKGRDYLEESKRWFYKYTKKGNQEKVEYFKQVISSHQKAIRMINDKLMKVGGANYHERYDDENFSEVLKRHKKLDTNRIGSIFASLLLTSIVVLGFSAKLPLSADNIIENYTKLTLNGRVKNSKISGFINVSKDDNIKGEYYFLSNKSKKYPFSGTISQDWEVIEIILYETQDSLMLSKEEKDKCFSGYFSDKKTKINFCVEN